MVDIHAEKILILDFGSQYTQLIARRVRELGVYCEIHRPDLSGLIDLIGADRVLFGSDFPHPEGLAEPAKLTPEIAELPEPVIEAVMGKNLRELLTAVPGGR